MLDQGVNISIIISIKVIPAILQGSSRREREIDMLKRWCNDGLAKVRTMGFRSYLNTSMFGSLWETEKVECGSSGRETGDVV